MKEATLPTLYRETPEHSMQRYFMTATAYEEAIRSFIIVCVDAVVIDSLRKTFWLIKRSQKPMQGVWVIGGRRAAGQTPIQAIERVFFRETSLLLGAERFTYVKENEYLWKDREQEPQNVGCHGVVQVFAVELTPQEREHTAANLEKTGYVPGWGLQEYNREKLLADTGIHKALLDLYDTIFPY